ncbi:hypothetical protein EJB05_55766, partial [Eragrostis curvula]
MGPQPCRSCVPAEIALDEDSNQKWGHAAASKHVFQVQGWSVGHTGDELDRPWAKEHGKAV